MRSMPIQKMPFCDMCEEVPAEMTLPSEKEGEVLHICGSCLHSAFKEFFGGDADEVVVQ